MLDASALLALLDGEAGAGTVAKYVEAGTATISSVTYAEVAGKLSDYGVPDAEVRTVLGSLGLTVEPFTESPALMSAVLRARTRHAGLSLGDRACLALAHHAKAIAVTGDRVWQGLTDIDLEFLR